MASKIPPATRPPRSAARTTPGGSTSSPPSTPSPLSSGARLTRPAAPASRRGTPANPGRSSPRTAPERPPSAGSPERPTSRSSFYASLARETEEKEALVVKVQEHEATITGLTSECSTLHTAITAAEIRITELYEEQARMEDELAARNVVTEKLRNQVRELEKEERDLRKRYNDQTQTFDAERQAFYDGEQHLKSRIQNLTQARQHERLQSKSFAEFSDTRTVHDADEQQPTNPLEDATEAVPSPTISNEDHEAPDMIALRLEFSTLMTSHSSLQNTVQLLQNQLQDLQRVNKELQEENESYNSLLLERTMAGQFDIRRSAPSSATWPQEEDDSGSVHGTVRSVKLEAVAEVDEQAAPLDMEIAQSLLSPGGPRSPSPASTRASKRTRRAGSIRNASPKGETLADLPVAGPGLDLAAELGRAESKDMVNGFSEDHPARAPPAQAVDINEYEALRAENKALKDANKALSLYASKILDRIIGHGGFESVLAADGDAAERAPIPPTSPVKKSRPQSLSFLRSLTGGSSSGNAGPPPPLAPAPPAPAPSENIPPQNSDTPTRRARRGLSIDWGRISIWASPNAPNDSPMADQQSQSTPTQTPVARTARKLDLPEDEEDRIARARLNAEMRLHGIEKGPLEPSAAILSSSVSISSADSVPPPSITSSSASIKSTSSATEPDTPATATATSLKARLPFFSRNSSSSSMSAPQAGMSQSEHASLALTSEALQQAEAEASIAAQEVRERALVEEMAKDPVKTTSFTEMPAVRPGSSLSERHRRRKSGGSQQSARSGASTLFSAGRMSMESMESSLGGAAASR